MSFTWSKTLIKWIYEYLGIRFVVLKFTGKAANDPTFREPPSGALWILGIYIAAFGLASQQYKNALDSSLILVSNYDLRDSAYDLGYCLASARYSTIVTKVPIKPILLSPLTVLYSLFGDDVPTMNQSIIKARELEEFAGGILTQSFLHVALLELEKETGIEYAFPANIPATHPEGHELLLDQPYNTWNAGFIPKEPATIVNQNSETFNVNVTFKPVPEPEWLSDSIDSHDLANRCKDILEADSDTKIARYAARRYDCTITILRRACQEGKILASTKGSTVQESAKTGSP